MAKKDMKVFADFMAENVPNHTSSITYEMADGQKFDVELKRYMTIDDKNTFVDRVANGCFDDEDEYHPEYREAIFQITVLQMLTNIPAFSKKVAELDSLGEQTGKKLKIVDIDRTYDLCRCLNLYEKVHDSVFCSLYDELQRLVTEKIIFKQQRILMGEKKQLERTRAEFDNGLALINSVADTLNETMTNGLKNAGSMKILTEFAQRAKNMSDSELIGTILQSAT